jgi:Glycosyl hydrolases family 32 N-terminal domain
MARRAMLLLVCLLALPTSAHSIQLHWADGSTSLDFSERTRAVLVVQADSAEVALPGQWTLQWLADSSGVNLVAIDSLAACSSDTAKASSVDPPSTPADSAAHTVTAHLCSNGRATIAYFLLDQPGGSAGRLRIAAIDPTDPDSSRVIESGEVTYNGGVEGEFTPVILRLSANHSTTQLRLTAVGVGLSAVTDATVASADGTVSIPLSIAAKSAASVAAEASVLEPLPPSILALSDGSHTLATTDVPSDQVFDGAASTTESFFSDPAARYYPKDFGIIVSPLLIGGKWVAMYHMYYTRTVKSEFVGNGSGQIPADSSDVYLGHAWSRDLITWSSWDSIQINQHSFRGHNSWDKGHAWAPSFIDFNGRHYMFYTGVDSVANQTIGYAYAATIDTTDDATRWTRISAPVHKASNTAWVASISGVPSQFRDPFVMQDPDSTGRLLMLYAAANASEPIGGNFFHNAIGVALSNVTNPDAWRDLGPYPMTTYAASNDWLAESPHMFPDSIGFRFNDPINHPKLWRLMYTDGNGAANRLLLFHNKSNLAAAVADRTAGNWTSAVSVSSYLNQNSTQVEYGMEATECLRLGDTFFLGGYLTGNDVYPYPKYGILLRRMMWTGTDFILSTVSLTTAVSERVPNREVTLQAVGSVPCHGEARFRLAVGNQRIHARLELFDIAGRRLRRFIDGDVGPGAVEVRWDGHDGDGRAVADGVYFARLSTGTKTAVLRVPLLH